jgi:hypothetical protein
MEIIILLVVVCWLGILIFAIQWQKKKKGKVIIKPPERIINKPVYEDEHTRVLDSKREFINYTTPPNIYGIWLMNRKGYSHKRTNK